jgi:DNA polymerase-1
MAVNAPVQGTSADVIRIAMVNIDKMLGSKDAHLILQVHDELIYEMKKDLIDELTPLIKMEMENVIKPKDAKGLTMVADVSVGDNWGEMKEIKL